ncbi:MAG: hypothetical protein MR361_07320 [Clostridiales bacterium]|nr:hypothetical protein [Clostridiales bacterium]
MACGFALIYLCILYFIDGNESGIATFLMLILFYGFMLKIIITQNKNNGGYIEDNEGVSGTIMYVTSALSPVWFVIIHLLLGGVCFWVYKKNGNDEVWKKGLLKD